MVHEKAILVNLSISQWTAKKHDDMVTSEVERSFGAKNAGRWQKLLIAREAIKRIAKVANEARTFHYENTLPWNDNGERLLPVANLERYKATVESLRAKFHERVNDFCENYPMLIEEARERLNGMFREEDYPPPERISSKFSFKVGFAPVPHHGDFRVNIRNAILAELREELKHEVESRQAEADRELWFRMRDAVRHMVDKLTPSDAIFRDSLVQNVRDLCELLKVLNFHEDQEIEALRQEIELKLTPAEPESLRKNRALRSEVAQEAQQILKKIETSINTRRLRL